MAQADRDTVQLFAKRSDQTVMRIAIAFAMGGALMDILSHALPALLHALGIVPANGGMPMLWGLWIPLCFLTIPPLHYLCRYVTRLEDRVQQLEQRLNLRDAA